LSQCVASPGIEPGSKV